MIKLFYTYLLIDPRDNSVFYVGKGHGKRSVLRNQEKKKDADIRGVHYYKGYVSPERMKELKLQAQGELV